MIFYFVIENRIIGIIIFGIFLAGFALSISGWSKEIFLFGQDNKISFRSIVFFVGAEIIIFGIFIISFFSTRIQFAQVWKDWIPGEVNYLIVLSLTLILWASSFTIHKAEKSVKERNLLNYRIWLILTIILGTLFLILHINEWIELWHKGFTISSNGYGNVFYSLTGVHASHVVVGIII
ncbi:MAG: cytochrome c oxidase subunit 3, partial [Brevinematia bacterium]